MFVWSAAGVCFVIILCAFILLLFAVQYLFGPASTRWGNNTGNCGYNDHVELQYISAVIIIEEKEEHR
jgi:hypothetical protein